MEDRDYLNRWEGTKIATNNASNQGLRCKKLDNTHRLKSWRRRGQIERGSVGRLFDIPLLCFIPDHVVLIHNTV
jgi:hypothetical protein